MWLTDDELIQNAYSPLTEDDLQSAEVSLGFRLPSQYRDFLLWSNGGTCPEEVLAGYSSVSDFIPLKQELNIPGLLEMRQGWEDIYPEKWLAIAGNECGDYFCIHRENGKIYLPFHDDPFQDFALLRAKADSLSEFLLSLQRELPEDEPLQKLPEFSAVREGNRELLQNLLKNRDHCNLKNENYESLLHYAIRLWRRGIVTDILKAGANPELKDDDGDTALIVAALVQTVDTGRILIQHGANVNATDSEGNSVLIRSVSCGNLRLGRELIAAGADLDYRAPNGISALELCRKYKLI